MAWSPDCSIAPKKDEGTDEDTENESESRQRGKQKAEKGKEKKPADKEEGKREGKEDSGTGGLGLGFGDLYEHEDAFGHRGKKGEKVEGNLTKFRTALELTSLAPPLSSKQTQAALELCNYDIMGLKKLDEASEREIGAFGKKHGELVEVLRKVQRSGLTNLQISEFCGCYLRVIETLIGGDGSMEVRRELSRDVDGGIHRRCRPRSSTRCTARRSSAATWPDSARSRSPGRARPRRCCRPSWPWRRAAWMASTSPFATMTASCGT
jgi:hypothetical protein